MQDYEQKRGNPQQYCHICGKDTEHTQLPTVYATKCLTCGSSTAGHDRAQAEANVFFTPDGKEAKVVHDDAKNVVFRVEKGEHSGMYVYDKNTGFGAIQNRPPLPD